MTSSVREWLKQLGLPQYADAFESNDIDVALISHLTDQVLKEIGVASVGHRLKILAAINESHGLASTSAPAQAATAEHPAAAKPEAERRHLRVLFCDLVASTDLSHRLDPEDFRDAVRAYQAACGQVIAKYEGHIAQYLGDGLLVYFGYPNAHEDDAPRAIRAALGIISAVSTLKLRAGTLAVRVGVHTGLTVVGEVGSGSTAEQLALGATPNIAARLQALAKPNAVVVSSATLHLAAGLFTVRDLGLQTLKGVPDPTRAYQVLEEPARQNAQQAAPGRTPLIGRELEVGLLLDRWEKAVDGQGQVVLLTGEPGIGKSRLMRVLGERISTQPHVRLEYRCSPYYTQSPLYPVIDALPRILEWEREDTTQVRLTKLAAVLTRRGLADTEALPLLAALLSLPETSAALPVMSPERQKRRTLETLVAWVLALAGEQPVLLAIEDLHWIDPTTLELIGLLVPLQACADTRRRLPVAAAQRASAQPPAHCEYSGRSIPRRCRCATRVCRAPLHRGRLGGQRRAVVAEGRAASHAALRTCGSTGPLQRRPRGVGDDTGFDST